MAAIIRFLCAMSCAFGIRRRPATLAISANSLHFQATRRHPWQQSEQCARAVVL